MRGERAQPPGEGGQALIVAALAMAVLVGLTALAIDIGLLFQDRRHLQNAADAAALAGVAELPDDPEDAVEEAEEWAFNNGISPEQITKIEVRTTSVTNDTLYVELDDDFNWLFARVLGMATSNVGAEAAAQIGSLGPNSRAMPWALLEGDSNCLDSSGNAIFGADCVVKVGADSSAISGWYGALDYDGVGGGASEYRDNIIDGTTDTIYCIEGQASPPCQASVVDALHGNKTGPTDIGIDLRLATGPACDGNDNGTDDFDEVFVENDVGDADYTVACPDSPRLIILPIVSYDSVPVQDVTIEGWTLAYLRSYSCVGGSCRGRGHWEVQITIVDAVYSQSSGFMAAYDPEAGITIRRLIE